MAIIIALLNFMRFNAADMLAKGRVVFAALTGNTAFGTLPVALTVLDTACDDLETAIANQPAGGPSATALQEEKRLAVGNILHRLAIHCQENCNGDPAVFLTSGFDPAQTSGPSSPLPRCAIRSINNGATTQLVAEAEPMDNATGWEAQISVDGGPFVHAENLGAKRKMTLINLVPGKLYMVRMRAQGGSTGYSDWSDPVQHMCM